MTKTSSYIQIVLFCLFLGVFFLLFLTMPDTDFSEQENRPLSQAPEFTVKALFSGQFSSKFESYSTDQFPFRDSWTTVKAASELFSGKSENKGVYLCQNDTLIEGYASPDPKQLESNINAVASLAESAGVPVYFCLVPGIAEVQSDIVPRNAPNDSQLEVIEYCYARSGATNIDCYSTLMTYRDEYVFYRTDHHWTTLGAYYSYAAIMEAMGKTAPPLSAYDRKEVTDEFYGTIYSKSGMSWVEPDSIEVFIPQAEGVQVFNYVTGEGEVAPLYDYSFLEKKDKYSLFMGGITPLIKIVSQNTDAPSLLILRDSYAATLIPFMQEDFSEIHLIDLRYFRAQLNDSTIADYVRDNDIDEVLICYSTINFGTDVNVTFMRSDS